jgi:hypothetical protein
MPLFYKIKSMFLSVVFFGLQQTHLYRSVNLILKVEI